MEREKPVAFARRLGVHKSSISRAIQAGRLQLIDGYLDVEDNLRRWEATKIGSRPDVGARHAAQRAEHDHDPSEVEENATESHSASLGTISEDISLPAGPMEQGTLPYYTAQRIAAQNNLVKLGMQLRAQQRYPLDGVRREAYALGGILRSSLERLIDQTAPRLAALSTPADRRQLLAIETRQLRRDLQREFLRALRRLRAIHAQKGESP